MPLAASRVMMRHSTSAIRRAGIRNASSTSEAAGAAKDTAAKVQSKASDGLSRVTSSAGPLVSKAGSAAAGVMSRLAMVGGRTGRLVGRIQSLIPPTIYYSKVGLELGRLVFQQRKMDLPSVATFQSSFARLRNPSSLFSSSSSGAQPTGILNRVRNLSTAEWASVGVVAAEVIGFFSVGEMIGRMKLVGYRSSAPAHH